MIIRRRRSSRHHGRGRRQRARSRRRPRSGRVRGFSGVGERRRAHTPTTAPRPRVWFKSVDLVTGIGSARDVGVPQTEFDILVHAFLHEDRFRKVHHCSVYYPRRRIFFFHCRFFFFYTPYIIYIVLRTHGRTIVFFFSILRFLPVFYKVVFSSFTKSVRA